MENEMKRSELIELIAKRKGLSQRQSEEVVQTLFGEIASALQAGDWVEIRGFGRFSIKDHDSYLGRNPKTGEQVKVNPKKVPFFKASSTLKERLTR
jgi:integration host factor subunit beta